jgi:glycosyltransferase involved in cell wall biosynthesis
MPRVTVIIPTYNRGALLRRALDSVFAQTYSDFEVLVADDGSTDDTFEVCKAYARVRYLPAAHSGLPATARNRALASSAGEYVAFLDSDDQWIPDKLRRQVEALTKKPSLGLVCSNAITLSDRGPTEKLYLRQDQGKSGSVFLSLLQDNFVVTSTAMVRRSILESVGNFCEERALRGVEDYDLWLRIAARSELVFLPEALAIYQLSPTSLGREQGGALHWTSLLRILARMKELSGMNTVSSKAIADRVTTCHAMLCDTYAVEQRYGKLFSATLKFFAHRPFAAMRYLRSSVPKAFRRQETSVSTDAERPSLRLHLGCGERYLEGYVNIDLPASSHTVQSGKTPDIHKDITTLKYEEASVDEIRLHHVFEHFDRPTALRLLIEWYLWLRERGRLVIETPDLMASMPLLESGSPELQFRTLRHLFGSHEATWALHKDGWYAQKFQVYLQELGFEVTAIERNQWQNTHNITITAEKLPPLKSKDILLKSAEKLLRLSLVDNSASERRLLVVWMDEIRSQLSSKP